MSEETKRTVAELKEEAKALGITGYSKMKHEELVQAIEAAGEEKVDPIEEPTPPKTLLHETAQVNDALLLYSYVDEETKETMFVIRDAAEFFEVSRSIDPSEIPHKLFTYQRIQQNVDVNERARAIVLNVLGEYSKQLNTDINEQFGGEINRLEDKMDKALVKLLTK